jgi:hypothetical protein
MSRGTERGNTVLLLVTSLKLLTEVALLALLGQGVLALLAGGGRQANPFYVGLQIVTRPVLRLTRRLVPRVVLDAHIPYAAAALLAGLWLGLVVAKVSVCLSTGMAGCR